MPSGIDFNPRPSFGANPFEPLQQGIQSGIGLGLGVQRLQQNAQNQKIQQEQQVAQKKQAAQKSFQFGLEFLSSPTFKSLSQEKKQEIAKQTAVAGQDGFGLPIELEGIDFNNPAFSKVAKDLSVIMKDKSLSPEQKVDLGQSKIAESAGEFTLPGDNISQLQSFLPSSSRASAARTSGLKIPSTGDRESLIVGKFLEQGLDSLTPEEKVVFNKKFGKDNDLVEALKLVGGNLQNIGSTPEELLKSAVIIADQIKKAKIRSQGINTSGGSPQPGNKSPILSVRPKTPGR